MTVLPGRAAEAEQLHLRPAVVGADGGEVLVAERVELAGAHDHVAPTAPSDVEHRPVGVVGLDRRAAGPGEGGVVGDQRGLAVRHHQVGLERGAGRGARRSSGPCRSGWRGSPRRRGSSRRSPRRRPRRGSPSPVPGGTGRDELLVRGLGDVDVAARGSRPTPRASEPPPRTRAGGPRRARSRGTQEVKCAAPGRSTTRSTIIRLTRSRCSVPAVASRSPVGTTRSTER